MKFFEGEENFSLSKLVGFTLAEVLITLAVVGVVAAITMPMLISNINERVNSKRQANIVYKVTQAMEHMRATGKLTAYDSTESFVNELQKHLKIQKICDKDHIAECWPTDKVTTGLGEDLLIKDVKTSKNLMLETGTNNVGLILADGASLILNFDSSFQGMDIGDKITASSIGLPVGNNRSKVFEYTTSVTSPVAFVMDVNGKKGPNKETTDGKYYDVRSFGGARLSSACAGDYYNGTCVYLIGTSYTPLNCYPYGSNSGTDVYNKYCGSGYTYSGDVANDNWAGAQAKCDSINMRVPTVSELQAIYNNKLNYPSIASSIGQFWSSEEYSDTPQLHGRFVRFNLVDVTYDYKALQHQVLCVNK